MYYIPTELYYDIIFWAIGENITWQWRHNSFSFKSNFSPYRPELWKCFTLRMLWCLPSVTRSFTEIYERNFEISWNFYKKGITHAWTEDWTLCRRICYFLAVSEMALSSIRFAKKCPFKGFIVEKFELFVCICSLF